MGKFAEYELPRLLSIVASFCKERNVLAPLLMLFDGIVPRMPSSDFTLMSKTRVIRVNIRHSDEHSCYFVFSRHFAAAHAFPSLGP